jgi:uncharacterized protein (DUF433 family)
MEFSMVNGAKKRGFSLYGGVDPADLPIYSRVDASRATGVPASTIGVWVSGMPYTTRKGLRSRYEAVVTLPDPNDARLSFNNLLEVNVLRALRQVHEVRLRAVRDAMENANGLGIDRLLIHSDLRTSGGALFLDRYFELVDLSNSKQLAMRSILEHSLQRVEVDAELRALNFFPYPRRMAPDQRPILVSPYVSFGSSIIERRGISTSAISERVDSGEGKSAILADFDLTEDEFEEAILYEAAA